MAYTVLARKWRPQTFDDVVGQDHVVQTLRNAVKQRRIAQAYLFVGPRGTGKTTLSRIFAKALNCEKGPTDTPCGECSSCKSIMAGNSLDVSEIDGASYNKVEDVHEIVENIGYSPVGRYRVCYIDEVHMLSPAAFNALLKTLEEPPEHAKFIFATTEPEKVPVTVLSRCQRFDLRRIPIPLIAKQLKYISGQEGITIDDDALYAIARGADGGMRDALSALDQLISFTGKTIREEDVLSVFGLVARKALLEIAGAVIDGDVPQLFALVDEQDRHGKDLRRLAVELIGHFRDLLAYVHTKGAIAGDAPEISKAFFDKYGSKTNSAAILKILEILIDLDGRLAQAIARRTLLETALLRASRAASAVPLETILKRLNELGAAPVRPSADARPAPVPASVVPPPVRDEIPVIEVRPMTSSAPVKEAAAAELDEKSMKEAEDNPKVKLVRDILGGSIVGITG